MSGATPVEQLESETASPRSTVLRDRSVLFVLIALFVALTVKQIDIHPQLGVDEIYYFDYALKSPSLGIRIGEQVGTEAMTVAACRGIEIWPGALIPECGDPRPDPNQLWQDGYNVTFQHPPAYFSITAIGGEVMGWLPGVDNKLTAYRLVGVVWLAAGMVLLWYALGLAKLPTVGKAAVVALLGAPPMAVYTAASVHAGNTQLAGGALLLVALLLWESGRWRWWAVPAAAAVAVWLNFNNAAAVGALVAYLAYKAWRDRGRNHDLVRTAASSFTVAVVSVIGWQAWQNHRKLADVDDLPVHQVTLGQGGFHWQQIDDELRAVFTPFRNQWIQTWDVLTSLTGVADIGLIVLMGTTLAVTANKSTFRYFTAGVVTAMVGFGIVTMVSTYAAGYNYFQLTPARYGLALLPFAGVAIVPALRRFTLARVCTVLLAAATCAAIAYGVFASSAAIRNADITEALRRAQREQQIEAQQQTISEQQQQLDEKESQLNQYRCQLGADLDQVPEGCE
ncbi:MAG: hypothetical protein OXH23_16280 [bacterium]|nr:hypothetical protein [bacterium]